MFKNNNFYLVLQIRLFRNFVIADGIADLGTFLAHMGFVFLAYDLTDSPAKTTGVLIVQVVPYLLFGLLGGAVSDTINKIKLMVSMDMVRAVLQGICLYLYITNTLTYVSLLIIAFVIQVCGAFFNPASRGIVPELVDKNQLVTANALMSIIQNLCKIGGPVLATLIITYGTMELFFLLDMISYIVSGVLLLRLHPFFANKNTHLTVKNVKNNFSNFGYFLKQNKAVRLLFITTFILVFTQKWAWSLGVLFKQGIDSISGKQDYATLMLIFTIVSVLSGIFLGSRNFILSFKSYALGALLWGLGLLIFAITPPFYGDIFGVISIAIGLLLTSQSRVYLLQNLLDKNIISQGFSLAAIILYTADFLSLIVFGFLYSIVSLQYIFVATSIVLIFLSCLIILLKPYVEKG